MPVACSVIEDRPLVMKSTRGDGFFEASKSGAHASVNRWVPVTFTSHAWFHASRLVKRPAVTAVSKSAPILNLAVVHRLITMRELRTGIVDKDINVAKFVLDVFDCRIDGIVG